LISSHTFSFLFFFSSSLFFFFSLLFLFSFYLFFSLSSATRMGCVRRYARVVYIRGKRATASNALPFTDLKIVVTLIFNNINLIIIIYKKNCRMVYDLALTEMFTFLYPDETSVGSYGPGWARVSVIMGPIYTFQRYKVCSFERWQNLISAKFILYIRIYI
jgi:hypothetical protein